MTHKQYVKSTKFLILVWVIEMKNCVKMLAEWSLLVTGIDNHLITQ